MADALSPAQARDFVLSRIARDAHVEPFRWRGVTFHARVPSMIQLEVARAGKGAVNSTIFLASLATQCTEIDGALVFAPTDLAKLVVEQPNGFLAAFYSAVKPFLEAPVLPAALVDHG